MPECPFPMPLLDSLIQGERPICYGVLKPGIEDVQGVPLVRIVDMDSAGLRPEGLFRITHALDKEFARSRIDAGDLLLSIQGTVGRVAIAPPELAGANISRTIARLSFAAAGDGRFYKHWFLSSDGLRAIDGAIVGTTRSSLNIGVLRKVAVPSPTGPEKSAIADILDALDTTIRQTEAIIEKLKQVKQGLLHDLLTRGIDANGKLRPPQSRAPHLYKESPLGWIPREWVTGNLGALAEIASGVTLGRSVTGMGTVELPYLRVANVQDGYLDLSEVKSIRILTSELPRYRLEPGDVLMNEGGDFDKLGRGVMWSGEIADCLHQNHVFRVRCNGTYLTPRFLATYSSSSFGKAFFVQASKQTTNLASINSTQLKTFPLRLPTSAEQRAIVDRLDALDSRIEIEVKARRKLGMHKSGLMDDLLTGRVRVTPLLESTA